MWIGIPEPCLRLNKLAAIVFSSLKKRRVCFPQITLWVDGWSIFDDILKICWLLGTQYWVLSTYGNTYLRTYIPYDLYKLYPTICTYWTYCTYCTYRTTCTSKNCTTAYIMLLYIHICIYIYTYISYDCCY